MPAPHFAKPKAYVNSTLKAGCVATVCHDSRTKPGIAAKRSTRVQSTRSGMAKDGNLGTGVALPHQIDL